MDVAVVDSGGANLASVLFALERIGASAKLSRDADEIFRAPRVVLPGVGAARSCMNSLRARELLSCLRELKQPALGICLGMQLLYDASSEGAREGGSDDGQTPCLGLISGLVRGLEATKDRPVPHMGWNEVSPLPGLPACPLLDPERRGEYYYFVHSFAAPLGAPVRATADYGEAIPAVIEWKNWFGAQFHPERSGAAGSRFLRRFLEHG